MPNRAIACERPGAVQTASTCRRRQRFFRHVRPGEDWALPLLIGALGQQGAWVLARDRMSRQIRGREANLRVLAVVTRMTLIERYLAHFPAAKTDALPPGKGHDFRLNA